MTRSFVTAASLLLVILLLAAVVADLRSRRISNLLVSTGLGLAILWHAVALGVSASPLAGDEWWSPLAGSAVGFALMLPLYALRASGAGDVKLMAMVGAFVGAPTVVWVSLYTMVAGGLLSLVFLFRPGVAARTLANVNLMLTARRGRAVAGQGIRMAPMQTTAARLPYAVAIALGTGAALLWPLARS